MSVQSSGEYLALARKYRPQNFDEVVGQEHVLAALGHSIDTQHLHHAYLLTGTRGIGKTTIARIFAKSLECEKGISSHPCGECDSCKDITKGSFLDVIEIDAASQTKVDDTRQLLENTQYPPVKGRYKIYIIDEVHMLSASSFNALLKTLEEPPSYVKFILATTDPHKIPTTVLSRCLTFRLRSLNTEEIRNRLAEICTKENVAFENEALLQLARAARGSMRDALSLCDQAIALGNGSLSLDSVQSMLGTVGDILIGKIFRMLSGSAESTAQAVQVKQLERFGGDLNEAAVQLASQYKEPEAVSVTFADLLKEIREQAPNYRSLLDELVVAFHDLALYQMIGGSAIDVFSFNASMLEHFAGRISPSQVQLYYRIVLEGIEEFPYAADGRAAFEMTLLRLLAFVPEKKKYS